MSDDFNLFFIGAILFVFMAIGGLAMYQGAKETKDDGFAEWLAPRGAEFSTIPQAREAYGEWLEREEYRKFLNEARGKYGKRAECVNGWLALPGGEIVIYQDGPVPCGR